MEARSARVSMPEVEACLLDLGISRAVSMTLWPWDILLTGGEDIDPGRARDTAAGMADSGGSEVCERGEDLTFEDPDGAFGVRDLYDLAGGVGDAAGDSSGERREFMSISQERTRQQPPWKKLHRGGYFL